MKTLIQIYLIVFAIAFFQQASAQIQQGSFRVGGSAGYSRMKLSEGHTYRQLSLYPSIAYFPVANLSVGLTTSVLLASGKNPNGTYNATDYTFGPEVRYYFPFGKWAVFPEVRYSFGKSKSKGSSWGLNGDPILSEYKTEITYQAFRGGVGLTYFINPNIGVEGVLFYQNSGQSIASSVSDPSDTKSINFNLGFQIYLNRK